MREYGVTIYLWTDSGKINNDTYKTVEATSMIEAASKAVGEPLTERGSITQLRAKVWDISNPLDTKHFYSTSREIRPAI